MPVQSLHCLLHTFLSWFGLDSYMLNELMVSWARMACVFVVYWALSQTFNCMLTYWGRATHISISKQTIIGSDNGLSHGRRQAIIWTNDGILLTGTLGTNFHVTLSDIYTFFFMKMHLKMWSGKRRSFRLGLNKLMFKNNMENVAKLLFYIKVYSS